MMSTEYSEFHIIEIIHYTCSSHKELEKLCTYSTDWGTLQIWKFCSWTQSTLHRQTAACLYWTPQIGPRSAHDSSDLPLCPPPQERLALPCWSAGNHSWGTHTHTIPKMVNSISTIITLFLMVIHAHLLILNVAINWPICITIILRESFHTHD